MITKNIQTNKQNKTKKKNTNKSKNEGGFANIQLQKCVAIGKCGVICR